MIFRHFQRCVSKYVFKESILLKDIHSLQQVQISPILNMVTNKKKEETVNAYYHRIVKQYNQSFNRYSSHFHVVKPSALGDNAGRIIINTNKVLNKATSNQCNCKIILNTLQNYDSEHEYNSYYNDEVLEQYTYLYNTEHTCNVYKIYNYKKDMEKLTDDVNNHCDFNIYLGIVIICEYYEKYVVQEMLKSYPNLKSQIIFVDKIEYIMSHSKYGNMIELMYKPDSSDKKTTFTTNMNIQNMEHEILQQNDNNKYGT